MFKKKAAPKAEKKEEIINTVSNEANNFLGTNDLQDQDDNDNDNNNSNNILDNAQDEDDNVQDDEDGQQLEDDLNQEEDQRSDNRSQLEHNIDEGNLGTENEVQENEVVEEQIPTDKDELIEYLKNKLHKTHDTVHEAFNVLTQEKHLTGNLMVELETKKRELSKIQQSENRPIREKVHEKIEQTLEKSIEEKVRAENERNELKALLEERKMMLGELNSQLRYLQHEDAEKGQQLELLQKNVEDYDRLIEELKNKKLDLEDQELQKDNYIKYLLKEREDMKGVMYKLSDVKNVLNRLLSNPRLLYPKDSTALVIDENLGMEHFRHSKMIEAAGNTKTLAQLAQKPAYLKNEEDFWYADPTKQEYAKDFGGRDNNYNQQYLFNQNASIQKNNPINSTGEENLQGTNQDQRSNQQTVSQNDNFNE